MSQSSPVMGLPYIQPSQAQKHVTHNEALRILDAVTQLSVLSAELNAPPAEPVEGDRYIVAPPGAGDWAGRGHAIAVRVDNTWQFFVPRAGWRADVQPTGAALRFDGASWVAASDLASVAQLGIGTGADATNRLAVASPATLLTHTGGGHQLKVNKAAPEDTASLLFQTGFSGRAEMGTAGSDSFAIKVSADGATFQTALSVDAATGRVSFPAAPHILRERLNAPRTYYIRSDGSNANDGRSDTATGAFATLMRAISEVMALDSGPHDVTIQVGPGTYDEVAIVGAPLLGAGTLHIIGNTTDPSAVQVRRVQASGGARLAIAGLEFTQTNGLAVTGGADVAAADVSFAGPGSAVLLRGGRVTAAGSALRIGAAVTNLVLAEDRGTLDLAGSTLDLAAGIAWGAGGALTLRSQSFASLIGTGFSGDPGSATGPRYDVVSGAMLDLGGQPETLVPGDAPGNASRGGQVV